MDDGRLDALGQTIVSALAGAATGHSIAFNQLTVSVQADKIVDVVKFLRDDPSCRFVSLIDVTVVDYPGREKRFDVVYHLLSPTLNTRIRLRGEADMAQGGGARTGRSVHLIRDELAIGRERLFDLSPF